MDGHEFLKSESMYAIMARCFPIQYFFSFILVAFIIIIIIIIIIIY